MRVLITGGGTGGHVYPALAIARGIKEHHPKAEILYVGTAQGIEADIVPREGFVFRTVPVTGMHRKRLSLKSLKAVLKTIVGSLQAYRIIREFKPTVVVGTGGYVCFPVVLTAAFLKIPTLIHEQNAYPGLTNKVLARFASRVAVTFPESEKYFTSKARFAETGLPVRQEVLQARREQGVSAFGLDNGVFTVVTAGGSQGARSINKAMVDVIARACGKKDIQFIHVTGRAGYDEVISGLTALGINPEECGNVTVRPYLYNMEEALAAANLVVCRAGATTLAEITARGLPAVLIPYPYATANHQEHNAAALVRNGAAVMIKDSELTGEKLWDTFRSLFQDGPGLSAMAAKSGLMGKPEALGHLIKIIEELSQ